MCILFLDEEYDGLVHVVIDQLRMTAVRVIAERSLPHMLANSS